MPEEQHADANAQSVDPLQNVVGESFAPVYRAEIDAIAARRAALHVRAGEGVLALPDVSWGDDYRPSSTLTQVFEDLKDSNASWEAEVSEHGTPSGLIGVALSGGGIRSSSFNLGVLQAIHRIGLFPYVDYLSTVSGGGYIGTYLTTSIIEDEIQPEKKPESEEHTDPDAPVDRFPFMHKTGQQESPRFRHLRHYAKFLAPGRKSELLSIPILLLRGLVINLLFLSSFYLIAGMVLGLGMTGATDYQYTTHVLIAQYFRDTVGYLPGSGLDRLFGYFPLTSGVAALLLLSFVGFPIVHTLRRQESLLSLRIVTEKRERTRRRRWLKILRVTLIVGLILFFVELQPVVLTNTADIKQWLVGFLGGAAATAPFADKIFARLSEFQAKVGAILFGLLAIIVVWLALLFVTKQFADGSWTLIPGVIAALLTWAFSLIFVDVNATSIHNFYRDHLVKAFVAQAAADDMLDVPRDEKREEKAPKKNPDEEKVPKLSELDVDYAPYHLINVTINVEHEDVEYRSGRHGSFFFFSPLYCGGIRTGYLPTRNLERIANTLDVGTAMAVSGASVAPNMGKFSNRFVAFILALLNIRLNYWLQNPKRIIQLRPEPIVEDVEPPWTFSETWLRHKRVGPYYLLNEMFQRLSVNSSHVNLSDGGHIENLGIYELMRRQCRLIITGDGECDKELTFQGLTEAIRLARIDFGYRVEMDGLDEIRSGDQQFAIGTIFYSNDRIGKLIYIKSNLGGDYNLKSTLESDFYRSSTDRDDDHLYDESTYIAYYRDKHPDFPHESTADQFFDEAQFESYRALGYQVAATALIAPWVPDFEEEAD